jgi:hypothetical protein
MTLNGRNDVTNPFDIANANNHMYVEQNKVDLLRVLLDGKVVCNDCGHKFHSSGSSSMGYLEIAEWTSDSWDPDILQVLLRCGKCTHEGPFTMTPNPFMDVNKIDRYGVLVTAYRKKTASNHPFNDQRRRAGVQYAQTVAAGGSNNNNNNNNNDDGISLRPPDGDLSWNPFYCGKDPKKEFARRITWQL